MLFTRVKIATVSAHYIPVFCQILIPVCYLLVKKYVAYFKLVHRRQVVNSIMYQSGVSYGFSPLEGQHSQVG